MEAGQRSGRPVQSSRWRLAEIAAREADEPVRFGTGQSRPKQTIAPLATALNLTVRTFLKGQEPELVGAVKKAEDPVLISWQHEALPAIAGLIRGGADGVPPSWPGHVYDLVWVLDLRPSGAWSFTQVPELVMPGDSDKLIGLDG
jgi:hypothetical protein